MDAASLLLADAALTRLCQRTQPKEKRREVKDFEIERPRMAEEEH